MTSGLDLLPFDGGVCEAVTANQQLVTSQTPSISDQNRAVFDQLSDGDVIEIVFDQSPYSHWAVFVGILCSLSH